MGSWNSIVDEPAGHVAAGADLLGWSTLLKAAPEVYVAIKGSDQSVTSSTTLANDNDLTLSVVANAIYEVWSHIIYDAATAADLKFAWTAPAGATFDWVQGGLISSADAVSGSMFVGACTLATVNTTVTGAGSGTNMVCRPSGLLQISSTAGSFTLQWAQQTSSATATRVRQNSYLRLMRVG